MTIPDDVRDIIRTALEYYVEYWDENDTSMDNRYSTDAHADAEIVYAWLDAQADAPQTMPEEERVTIPEDVRGWIESAAQVASDSARYYDADSSSSDAVLAWLDAQAAAPEPDWTTAPDWAQWWAVSARGVASWWAGDKPYIDGALWDNGGGKLITYVIDLPLGVDWRMTLRRRPEVTP